MCDCQADNVQHATDKLIRTEFRALDADGDDFISVADLKAACGTAELEASDTELLSSILALDDDKDGQVGFDEYSRHRRTPKFAELLWASAAPAAVGSALASLKQELMKSHAEHARLLRNEFTPQVYIQGI